MTKPLIISKDPLTLAEVQSTLKALKKRDEELTFRGNKTEEYVNHVVKLSKTKSLEMKKKLVDLQIPRLKDEHIVKVIDIIPGSVAELKVLLQGYTVTISNENLAKMMAVVEECKK